MRGIVNYKTKGDGAFHQEPVVFSDSVKDPRKDYEQIREETGAALKDRFQKDAIVQSVRIGTTIIVFNSSSAAAEKEDLYV